MYKYAIQKNIGQITLAKDEQETMKAVSKIIGPLSKTSKLLASKFLDGKWSTAFDTYMEFWPEQQLSGAYSSAYVFRIAGTVS